MDQATGESGGTVVPSGLKQPRSRSAGQVRELALLEHRLGQAVVHAVEPEDDHPLEPAFRSARQPKSVRFSSRTGQVMKVSSADTTAAKTAKNEPARAKPAPGPM